MDLTKLNSLLHNLEDFRWRNRSQILQKQSIHEMEGGEEQGSGNEWHEVYAVEKSDFFLKFLMITDSYGSGEYIKGIQFVKPSPKQVIIYEPI